MGIALIAIAGLFALRAIGQARSGQSPVRSLIVAAAIGLTGVGIHANAHQVDVEAAAAVDWVSAALDLQEEMETKSAQAYPYRSDHFVRERWSEWAKDWEARQRDADRRCSAAARAEKLDSRQKAACEAIGAMIDVLRAHRSLIADASDNPRVEDLRKENLRLARDVVNQALARAAR